MTARDSVEERLAVIEAHGLPGCKQCAVNISDLLAAVRAVLAVCDAAEHDVDEWAAGEAVEWTTNRVRAAVSSALGGTEEP